MSSTIWKEDEKVVEKWRKKGANLEKVNPKREKVEEKVKAWEKVQNPRETQGE